MCLFFAREPGQTILELIVEYGLDTVSKGDIHFNLRKAGFNGSYSEDWDYFTNAEAVNRGLRGRKSEALRKISYFFPFHFSGYNGAIALGKIHINHDLSQMRRYMNLICLMIGIQASSLYLQRVFNQKEKEYELMLALTAHKMRHSLHNLYADFDEFLYLVKKKNLNFNEIEESLKISIGHLEGLTRDVNLHIDSPKTVKAMVSEMDIPAIDFEPLSIYLLLRKCIDGLRVRAQKKRCELSIDDEYENLPAVLGHSEMLTLAFNNLLLNAIEYSQDDTQIEIMAKSDESKNTLSILVKNIGLNINANEINRIFDMGYRGVSVRQHSNTPGYGIGLYQVKRILDLHDAKVHVLNNKVSKGARGFLTQIAVTLPILQNKKEQDFYDS